MAEDTSPAPPAARPEPSPGHGRTVTGVGKLYPIGEAPLDHDAPDLLEQIQRQVAGWNPRLVTGTYTPGGPSDEPNPFLHVPRSTISAVVRANLGRFRVCHGAGLPGSADVDGQVDVTFVISPRGAVTEARDTGGTFADEAVRQCVVRTFRQLSFPPPPGGEAQTETVPIVLTAGDAPLSRGKLP